MIFIFYIFAALLVFLSYKSFRGGIDYLNFFKRELAKPRLILRRFVSIIAPCRGFDEDLEENLSALFRQDFPRYEVIFVVDDEKDEAVEIIKKISPQRRGDARVKIIVAGKATETKHRKFTICAKRFCTFRMNRKFLFLLIPMRVRSKIGCEI